MVFVSFFDTFFKRYLEIFFKYLLKEKLGPILNDNFFFWVYILKSQQYLRDIL